MSITAIAKADSAPGNSSNGARQGQFSQAMLDRNLPERRRAREECVALASQGLLKKLRKAFDVPPRQGQEDMRVEKKQHSASRQSGLGEQEIPRQRIVEIVGYLPDHLIDAALLLPLAEAFEIHAAVTLVRNDLDHGLAVAGDYHALASLDGANRSRAGVSLASLTDTCFMRPL